MANWAYVNNNIVEELHDFLPTRWKNISGLHLSENDPEFLNSLGWFKVTKQHQSYDNTQYMEIGCDYSFNSNEVIEVLKLNKIEKIDSLVVEVVEAAFDQNKYDFLYKLRVERNIRLADCDWTQLYDVRLNFTDAQNETWQTYRQQLRDLPQLYENNDVVSLDQVIWPQRP